MHCNLRPPDAAPVTFRFNCDAHTKVESVNLSVPDLQRFYCRYLTLRCEIDRPYMYCRIFLFTFVLSEPTLSITRNGRRRTGTRVLEVINTRDLHYEKPLPDLRLRA